MFSSSFTVSEQEHRQWTPYKQGRLFDRVPTDTRRWEPSSDLPETAKEISKYIADSVAQGFGLFYTGGFYSLAPISREGLTGFVRVELREI